MYTVENIKEYLIKNPIDRSTENPYSSVAEIFNVDKEYIRNLWRKLRKKGLVEQNVVHNNVKRALVWDDGVINSEFSVKGDTAQVRKDTTEEVKTLKDLIRVCEINTAEWNIAEWKCKKWDLGIKDNSGEIATKQLYSVSAVLKIRKIDTDLGKQKNVLLEEIKDFWKTQTSINFTKKVHTGGEALLELAIPDLHLGKLAWREETGADYDLKIATQRYKDAISDLISKVPIAMVDRILLPIGNDMINVDGRNNSTTGGTPQDVDSRFKKILLAAKDLLVEVIEGLSEIAPVDVVIVSGNHDYDTMFTLGMVLEAFFNNHPSVTIDNAPSQRKYYQYHDNSIMFTHGNEEKHQDLGLIFATEKPKLWADTKYREVQLGHLHKNKKVNYVSVDEYQGFQVQIIPSLSATDFWHYTKGYMSLKAAKAFLYDKEDGKIGEFTYNIKTT